MTITSRVLGRAARLRPADTAEVVVERDVEAKMADGSVLLADRWYAPAPVATAPIVLIRSPYGRRQLGFIGRLFAERGYQAVVQSVRGTFGSEGTFEPFRHETEDGRATLDWLEGQAWFTGAVGTFGPSYLGLTQWAITADAPEFVRAMAMQVTAANVRDAVVFPGGSFSLQTGAFWVQMVEVQERKPAHFLWAMATSHKRLASVYDTLPLRDADTAAFGHPVQYYQDWLEHEAPSDPWWESVDYSRHVALTPPSSHVGGWFDLFLPSQIDDYCRLRDAGRDARLTVGPWTHSGPGAGAAGLRDALDWFDCHLRGIPERSRRGRVRLYVMGSDRWVELEDWPPPATPRPWYLHPGGVLSTEAPGGGVPDRYRHDPNDPAPSLGGATLDPMLAGAKNQSKREARPDVMVYTTAPLTNEVTVAGPVEAEVWVRSDRPSFDVYVRLCDVDRAGKSRNICDGILRVDAGSTPPDGDGISRVPVKMWPTAVTFKVGHRVRVQISGSAHPLFARNIGSGEPLATAATVFPSDNEVFHDSEHPSSITLPVSSI